MNKILLTGEILKGLEREHTVSGEVFYGFSIGAKRSSKRIDEVPLMISERITGYEQIVPGAYLHITGNLRTRWATENGVRRMKMYVFVDSVEIPDAEQLYMENMVILDGVICKDPVLRTTPKGYQIADVHLAVELRGNRSAYLPCIVFGRNAEYISKMPVGTYVKDIQGMFHSRTYKKNTAAGEEERVAHEICIECFTADPQNNNRRQGDVKQALGSERGE